MLILSPNYRLRNITFVFERGLISRCKISVVKTKTSQRVLARGHSTARRQRSEASSFHGSMQNASSTVISVSCQRKTIHAMSPIMEIMSHSGFRKNQCFGRDFDLCTKIYLIFLFYLHTYTLTRYL